MNKHTWVVEWKASHQVDGMARLGQAVRLVIGKAVDRSVPQGPRGGAPRRGDSHDTDKIDEQPGQGADARFVER